MITQPKMAKPIWKNPDCSLRFTHTILRLIQHLSCKTILLSFNSMEGVVRACWIILCSNRHTLILNQLA